MSDSTLKPVWLHKRERLPDTCITCGMFTHHRVSAKAVEQQRRKVAASETNSKLALGCLLHLLGPMGWILAALLHNGANETSMVEKTVTVRGTIKVPCCRLCAAQCLPTPEQARMAEGQFAFQAHPRFQERLQTLRQQAEQAS